MRKTTVTVSLATGEPLPALGLGTWRMGESASARPAEVAAVRFAIDCGYRLFDTAEMYGEGGAETVLGLALADALRTGAVRREEIVVVSKVYPHHASKDGVAAACDRSRKRLGIDAIDLYLLHWRGAVPLAETVAAFETAKATGAIREWGVSNFDLDDLIELDGIERPGKLHCATNQIYYALDERGAEFALLAYQRTLKMPTMAYCPLGRGSMATHPALVAIANARGATAAQIALAWTIRHGDVIAIPKAVAHDHVEENFAAIDLSLSDAECNATTPRSGHRRRRNRWRWCDRVAARASGGTRIDRVLRPCDTRWPTARADLFATRTRATARFTQSLARPR